ncbi:hypothetical protein MKX03_016325, partial [Papaver bracteatum]
MINLFEDLIWRDGSIKISSIDFSFTSIYQTRKKSKRNKTLRCNSKSKECLLLLGKAWDVLLRRS